MFVGVNEQVIMQKLYEKVVRHSQIRCPAPLGGGRGRGRGARLTGLYFTVLMAFLYPDNT